MAATIIPYFSLPANYPDLRVGYTFGSDDVSGTTLYDKSKNGLNGLLVNTPNFANTVVGRNMTLTAGSSQRVTIADNDNLSFATADGGAFSAVMVVKRIRSGNTPEPMLAKYPNIGNQEYIMGLLNNTMYFWCLDSTAGGYIGRVTAAGAWNDLSTYHILYFIKTAGTTSASLSIWSDNTQIDAGNFASAAYTQMRNNAADAYLGYCAGGLGVGAYSSLEYQSAWLIGHALTATERVNLKEQFAASLARGKTIYPTKMTI